MNIIKLTQGKETIVDDADFEWLSKYKWHIHKSRNTFYATRKAGNHPRRTIYMHRQILNARIGEMVDHQNHYTLDNRRQNIRICTKSQNQYNRNKQDGTSVFKGLHWNKKDKKWQAQIKYDGKRIHLGNFDDEVEAAMAYDRAAKELFGEFARTNF